MRAILKISLITFFILSSQLSFAGSFVDSATVTSVEKVYRQYRVDEPYQECYIQETVQSVQSQTYQDWEMIIIDDGSTDGSLQELINLYETYPELIVIIKLTRNFGQYPAIIAGYQHAKSKCVIIFFDKYIVVRHLVIEIPRTY